VTFFGGPLQLLLDYNSTSETYCYCYQNVLLAPVIDLGGRWVSRIRRRLVIGALVVPSSTLLVSIVAPTPGHYHYTYRAHLFCTRQTKMEQKSYTMMVLPSPSLGLLPHNTTLTLLTPSNKKKTIAIYYRWCVRSSRLEDQSVNKADGT
jgi:hypothetical protein